MFEAQTLAGTELVTDWRRICILLPAMCGRGVFVFIILGLAVVFSSSLPVWAVQGPAEIEPFSPRLSSPQQDEARDLKVQVDVVRARSRWYAAPQWVIATAFALVVVGVWLLLGRVSIRTTDTR